ncbi:amidohydrolase [Alicyclobacillus tolerans]|uniref:amidohydrolase family protein n=1 Tax=Alicyclobacillus tolerans TaxID=90970 RepID=UPI001F408493|nr:amidohydrolase family protein [Alicyclobacillus tolerans]MCF8567844.1 amidohydrolase [Alicyclobacillus tolerans]
MSSTERLSDIVVVDVDVHVHDTPTELAPYCDMPWRKSLEALKDVPERYLSLPGYAPDFGGTLPVWPGGHFENRAVDTPEQMRQELSKFNIDIGILFPDNLLKIATFPQIDYPPALARAYNRWIVDKWSDKQAGLKGLIVAAPQDPADAVKEIEKYKNEQGIVGIYLPCAGLDTLWGHPKYDPIFETAESAGLPVLLHSVQVLSAAFPCNMYQYTTKFGQHSISHSLSMMANMIRMIETGVPVRFPNLKIAFIEGGVSWVPYMMMRLDKEYIERRRELPFLEHPPSYYIRKMFYATQPIEEPEDPKDLVKIMEVYGGADNTMFASDWPHHDFDHPSKVFNLPLSPEIKRKIMGENALKFFNIDPHGRRLNLLKGVEASGN